MVWGQTFAGSVGDVNVEGTVTADSVVSDSLDTDSARLDDSESLTFGDDNDFELFYDGVSLQFVESGASLASFGKFGNNAARFTTDLTVGGNNILDLGGNEIRGVSSVSLSPQDVRNISNPSAGEVAFHDGSGNAGKGIAYFDGTNFQVLDGGTVP